LSSVMVTIRHSCNLPSPALCHRELLPDNRVCILLCMMSSWIMDLQGLLHLDGPPSCNRTMVSNGKEDYDAIARRFYPSELSSGFDYRYSMPHALRTPMLTHAWYLEHMCPIQGHPVILFCCCVSTFLDCKIYRIMIQGSSKALPWITGILQPEPESDSVFIQVLRDRNCQQLGQCHHRALLRLRRRLAQNARAKPDRPNPALHLGRGLPRSRAHQRDHRP
jgi:hypothetical protein